MICDFSATSGHFKDLRVVKIFFNKRLLRNKNRSNRATNTKFNYSVEFFLPVHYYRRLPLSASNIHFQIIYQLDSTFSMPSSNKYVVCRILLIINIKLAVTIKQTRCMDSSRIGHTVVTVMRSKVVQRKLLMTFCCNCGSHQLTVIHYVICTAVVSLLLYVFLVNNRTRGVDNAASVCKFYE